MEFDQENIFAMTEDEAVQVGILTVSEAYEEWMVVGGFAIECKINPEDCK